MLFVVDCGNTNVVFALYDGDDLKGIWRCKTDAARTADEYLAFISQHFELSKVTLDHVLDVIISSVVPDANFSLREFCQKGFGLEPAFIGSDITAEQIGIAIHIDRPQELGADRIVNAVSIREHYKKDSIVVDFGTATTIDVIGFDGAFMGGIIAPGVNLSMAALHAAAAKLPKISVARPPKVIGTNTVEAMQSGVFYGYAGLVEGLIARICAEYGSSPYVIATGGLAPLFKEVLPVISIVDEELTLKGLLSIYQRVKTL
ncbi:MAG: type III pantothenate kinase [Alphaproteobacteria bacterium]|jgi:type III pantothenate kinase|nr:type III pantothenate kinase [Alphaproteobacteria bacterium]MCB1552075.1 type III pantothenate kinase [Alphaproteobacteria bacterium]MCB9984882.1 type III pantothenate kinase [Micavibrio sp.]HRK97274.1 type III pantothenate kinase [Alphaproteobacteria bacterium]